MTNTVNIEYRLSDIRDSINILTKTIEITNKSLVELCKILTEIKDKS